ncbi:MAG: hypothetical protein LH632_00300 [Rhodoferax sp.]|nr:hypothetical protein [Rhodoferax sp.]
MQTLIVHAHPNPQSFNAVVVDEGNWRPAPQILLQWHAYAVCAPLQNLLASIAQHEQRHRAGLPPLHGPCLPATAQGTGMSRRAAPKAKAPL